MHNDNDELARIERAAAIATNWCAPYTKAQSKDWKSQSGEAVAQIDAAMLLLIDLAPERLSWNVLALCETLINEETETVAQMQATAELLNLIPAIHQGAAMAALCQLLAAAGRHICSWNVKPGVSRQSAISHGLIAI